ncbi:hypothetical protein BDN70DRAFT_924140 [Pholiota conissans]|uniref:Uncharacterized protein n=1 Tax=Pholiota conissans TaxID=109636 RepID=A0A9P5YTA3_9AGAR|nr:hypothetical protein BDN70DRAFT_924140 [Pholiota conissans]
MIPSIFLAVPGFQVQDIQPRDLLARQANTTHLSTFLATEIVLHAKPFNQLSIWTYIALAFIVLAVSTVIGYMTYTCCYSAKLRSYGTDNRASRRIGAVRLNSTKPSIIHWARAGKYHFGEEKGKTAAGDAKRNALEGDIGSESPWVKKTIVEMRRLAIPHRRTQSESEEAISPCSLNVSDNSFGVHAADHPFDADNHCLSSLPLAHTTERAATYVPFHLPPPPSSPTPTHKEFLERQKLQYYRGKETSSYSPVSPSPALFHGPSPDLSTLNPFSTPQISLKNQSHGKSAQDVHFISLINPFATPSTRIRRDDPKLSPIAGAFITNSPASVVSENHFVPHVTPNTGVLLSSNGKANTRLLSLRQADDFGGDGYRRDNLHPISQVRLGQENEQRDNYF